jgi:hypothetical protein
MYSVRRPGVLVRPAATTRKLSNVEQREVEGQRLRRPMARPPYVVATYVSISATCPSTCIFKDRGCFAQSGYIKRFTGVLDRQAAEKGLTGAQVAENEADALRGLFKGGDVPQDGAKGGRDLRLHVGGDTGGVEAAEILAEAARNWIRRGGGTVWTYTHRWREIPVSAFGPIAVWASTETFADAALAKARGYSVSITLPEEAYEGDKRQDMGSLSVIPCPWESRGVSCIRCRLCFKEATLPPNAAIGFQIHGMKYEREEAEAAWASQIQIQR